MMREWICRGYGTVRVSHPASYNASICVWAVKGSMKRHERETIQLYWGINASELIMALQNRKSLSNPIQSNLATHNIPSMMMMMMMIFINVGVRPPEGYSDVLSYLTNLYIVLYT